MGYRIFITQVNEEEQSLGTGVICFDFPSLNNAIQYGKSKLLFPESYFDVKLYYSDRNIIGGVNDNGEFVGRYYKKDFIDQNMTNIELMFIELENLKIDFNRMCMTDDVQELDKLKDSTIKRIEQIFNLKLEQLMQENAEKLDKIYPVTEESPNSKYRPPHRR